MGLFERFLQKPGESDEGDKSLFLDAYKSSSLGDVEFMRRSNQIRRTFPGTVDNPGMKERIEDVASMEAQMAKVSEGLPEAAGNQSVARVDPGVPKPVKKTFAQPMSQQQLKDRMKGSAVSTNVPGTTSKSAPVASSARLPAPAAQPTQPALPLRLRWLQFLRCHRCLKHLLRRAPQAPLLDRRSRAPLILQGHAQGHALSSALSPSFNLLLTAEHQLTELIQLVGFG